MKFRKTKSGRATSMARGLAIGTTISLAVTLISVILLAKMIDQEILAWNEVGYGVIAAILTASFIGSWTSYKKIQHQRLMVCLLTGALYWGILIGLSALLYSGEYQGVFLTSGLILLGCSCAFLFSGPRTRRTTLTKRRHHHR